MTAPAVPLGRVLQRVPSARASSFSLEELDRSGPGGSVVRLVRKDCSPARMLDQARRVRPAFLFDARREATMYRDVLVPEVHGTARCHAVHPPAEAPVLELERVEGPPLEEVGYGRPWHEAARWLARFHAFFAEDSPAGVALAGAPWLVSYDGEYFSLWPDRAARHLRLRDRRAAADIAALARRYDAVVAELVALPRSLVHGDFHPANVLVADGGRRTCVVDWELAGFGPSLLDLAALTSGRWPPARRAEVVESYLDAGPAGRRFGGDVTRALECCRLHLALQWLGWAPRWTPEGRRDGDWLAAARAGADRLGL